MNYGTIKVVSDGEEIKYAPIKHNTHTKTYTEDDLISFATYIYNQISDMPGHEPNIDQLKEWEKQK